jgi:large subunit ribosomal protein L25
VSDRPLHFDLMRVDANAPVKIEIAVHFKNADEAPFTRAGGMLEIVRHSVEILVAADLIPDELVVDLKGREIGENIRISDIDLPKGATTVIADRDFMIATIKNSAAGQSDAGDTTEAAAATEEA